MKDYEQYLIHHAHHPLDLVCVRAGNRYRLFDQDAETAGAILRRRPVRVNRYRTVTASLSEITRILRAEHLTGRLILSNQ